MQDTPFSTVRVFDRKIDIGGQTMAAVDLHSTNDFRPICCHDHDVIHGCLDHLGGCTNSTSMYVT
jgi:hypothetical protein